MQQFSQAEQGAVRSVSAIEKKPTKSQQGVISNTNIPVKWQNFSGYDIENFRY